MRLLALAVILSLLSPVLSADAEETAPLIGAGDVPDVDSGPSRAERIETLFDTLKASSDDAARQAERDLLRLWLESGSDTVDLLMRWAIAAMEEKKYPRALDFLDRVVLMKPDFAEGWNKRATVHFLLEDYGHSIADIGRVLEIEPRHFGALSGLGMMMRALGEEERAMSAYREALAINPHLDGVQDALEELETKRYGQDL